MSTPIFCWGAQICDQIFKKGCLTGSQFLEGGCRKRGGDFFQQGRGCNFYIKNKLKSEILNNNKKFINKNVYDITKNLNWQILSKNLVTFKR